jgi:hypothetical protein
MRSQSQKVLLDLQNIHVSILTNFFVCGAVSGSKPTAVRKWESVEDMPVNLMKDILKSFGEKGLSDLDRDDLVKEIKSLLQTKSLRTNSSSDD